MKKKKQIVTKKIYKTNTQLLRKIIIGLCILFLLVLLAIPLKNGAKYIFLNTWKNYEISKYNINFKLPRAYKELEDDTSSSEISSLISTNTNVKVNEEYISQKPEVVYSGGSSLNGISMMVECFSTSKTTKTLDQIADNQHVLVRIYYEDNYKVSEPTKEFLTILGTDAVSTTTELTNKKGVKTLIQYLVPMSDKEVTITFMGEKENVEKSMNEIEKIVKSFS